MWQRINEEENWDLENESLTEEEYYEYDMWDYY